MDEVLESFNNTLGPLRSEDTGFKDLYKNWGRFGNQEERRNELLNRQKSNRENKLDGCRGILALLKHDADHHTIQDGYRPSVYVPGFTQGFNRYNNILMFSEWIVEKPEDFSTNWYMIPCPTGTRTLVIASKGSTKCYTKYGQCYLTTHTMLPGGNKKQFRSSCSVLDGFYCKDIKTMYVLDVLTWNNHVMADGEMEFRNYWLQSKFDEAPELGDLSTKNRIAFRLLPKTPCDVDSLTKFLITYPSPIANMDGLLFYHKQCNYVSGETPLVGWLFPYMLPEVISPEIKIHEKYEAEKPKDYVDQATFIPKFEEYLKKKQASYKRLQWVPEPDKAAGDSAAEQSDSMQVTETSASITDKMEEQEIENATCLGYNKAKKLANGRGKAKTNKMESENCEAFAKQVSAVQPVVISKSLFCNQDSNQKQAVITKYYSYF